MSKEGQAFWQMLKDRHDKGKLLVKQGHFPECYMVAYPDDPEVHCTCVRNMCPDE